MKTLKTQNVHLAEHQVHKYDVFEICSIFVSFSQYDFTLGCVDNKTWVGLPTIQEHRFHLSGGSFYV